MSLPTPPCPVAADEPHASERGCQPAHGGGITVYGCEGEELALFRQEALRVGVALTVTDEHVSAANVELARGNRCVSVSHRAHISRSALRSLRQAGVRCISTRSVGHEHIDVDYARSLGVSVENITYSPDSVADYTLMMMLMVLRCAKASVIRGQAHDYRLHEAPGRELRDLTVGVVGTGRIGTAVLQRLRGFGCSVLAHDRYPSATADYVSLDDLIHGSDVVTLHTPLNEETHYLLDEERFEQMREGAYIINTGRGSLLDTRALLSALECGHLGGAALDVVEGEEGVFNADHRADPHQNGVLFRLQKLPNVLITPHSGYYTDHSLRDIVETTLAMCSHRQAGERWDA